MTRRTVLLGLGLALLSAISYGSNVPFAKLSAEAGVAGPDIVFYRGVLVTALLGAFVLGSGGSLSIIKAARGSVIGLGVTTSLVALCYISSVAFIPVGVATVIFYTFPLILLVVSPLIDRDAISLGRITIFLLAFSGLFVAIGPTFAMLDPRGLLLAAGAAVGAACQFFFASRATRSVDPAVAGFWTQAILVPIALATCLATGGPVPLSTLALAALPVALTCGLFVVAFSFHLFSARLAPPAALGLIFCAEPVTSIALASLVLDETLSLAQLAGGALVLLAILAAMRLESRRPRMAAS
jgi:drug/metabolite transporter (DMT)-like permease